MLTEAPPKEYTITVERQLPSDVQDKKAMLAGVLMKSGLYDVAGVEKILADCIATHLQLWLLRGDMDDTVFPAGVMITAVHKEPYSEKSWLLLMHVNDVVHISNEQWITAHQAILDYAKERGCQWVEVFTDNPRAYELLAGFGFRIAAFRKAV